MQIEKAKESGALPTIEKCKVYKSRWLMLGMFVIFSASNSMQWIEYSIIADVIANYYNVSTTAVDWLSMIYMALYIPFIFPASYILDKMGLRVAVLLGVIGTCAGSWIKVASASPDRFWVTFLGQGVVALSQIFILSVPARLAAVWFGPEQVSSACSIGVFGNQLGIAAGFLLPPMIVRSGGSEQATTEQLYIMFTSVAVLTSVLLIIIAIFFKSEPPTPPSFAQILIQREDKTKFLVTLLRLVKNVPYMLLLTAYGVNVGIFYAISTLLSQIILQYYPDGEQDAGRIGLMIVLAGMVGSVVCGTVLDRFHKFKETTLVVYGFSLIGMVIFTFTISKGIVVVYFVAAILGFFMTGLLPVGFELAAELTYPESESTAAGLLNCACQVFGITCTNIYSAIFNNLGDLWANSIMSILLVLGTILVACIKSDMKRQSAKNDRV